MRKVIAILIAMSLIFALGVSFAESADQVEGGENVEVTSDVENEEGTYDVAMTYAEGETEGEAEIDPEDDIIDDVIIQDIVSGGSVYVPVGGDKPENAPAEIVQIVPNEDESIEKLPDAEKPEEISVNVRKDASGLSEIIDVIAKDTPVVVYEFAGDWAKISAGGVSGYIYSRDLSKLENVMYQPKDDENDAEEDEKSDPVTLPVKPENEKKVVIFTSRKSVLTPGETIYLTSELIGFDGYEIMYQWQRNTGNGFEDIEGANEDTYAYEATIESLSYDWRLMVYYR